jgi:hypothetical protein
LRNIHFSVLLFYMSVTRFNFYCQAAKKTLAVSTLISLVCISNAQTQTIRFETHSNLQSVTTNGTSAWSGTFPFSVVGVLLTDPDEMLDSTPNFLPYNDGENLGKMGGEWQVVIQAVLPGDRGGTVCWMGQNYGNLPWIRNSDKSYQNDAWLSEINRVNHDPATGHAFRKGDLVMVTANRSLFYGGKRNINEAHDISPDADFTVTLVQSNFGLPEPEVISLASVVRPDDGNPDTKEDIFDPTRRSGGEYYQGMRVRITGIQLVTTDGWDPNKPWEQRKCTVTDGEGRFFTLRHPRYSLGPAPTGKFDAIGVFNQESGSGSDGTFGYELFVQQIEPATEPSLTIQKKVFVTWQGNFSNYRVVSSRTVDGTQWEPVTNAVIQLNGINALLLDPIDEAKFFKLERYK